MGEEQIETLLNDFPIGVIDQHTVRRSHLESHNHSNSIKLINNANLQLLFIIPLLHNCMM